MDDLISRQAAIDEIEERKFANRTVIPVVSELNRLEGYVLRLPSAQPEPSMEQCACCVLCKPERKKGKWIPICGNKACICSECNEEYDHTYEFIENWNFCPNCGADMRGEADEVRAT